MTNSARNKGRDFESMIRDYFRSIGLPVERIPAGMKDDRGDLSGIAGWTVQLKCYPRDMGRAIREGLADLEVQQANADPPYGAAIVKRPGKTDPGRQLVVMEVWQYGAVLLGQHRRLAS